MALEEIKQVAGELGLAGLFSVGHTANKVAHQINNSEMIDWTLHTLSVVGTTLIAGTALHLVKKLIDAKPWKKKDK